MADDELRVRASMEDDLSRPLENVREEVEDVRQELDRTTRSARTATTGLGRLGSGVGKLAGLVKRGLVVGLKAGVLAIGALAAAAVAGFTKMTALAMDAGETLAKFNTVFGQNRREMEAWVKTTHKSFGIATKDLRDATSTFGVFGQAAGIAEKQLPDFSQQLTQAGLDLASFYNVDPEEAFLSLRSGLAGEAEPLRKFGIFLSDAAMKTKAAAMGLRGELTESEKVMVRQRLIMEGLGKAEGDLERTSDSLANKWRALKGRTTELMTALGTGFMPIVTKVVVALEGRLEPVVTRISKLAPKLAQAFTDGTFYEGIGLLDKMAGAGGRLDSAVRKLHASGQLVGRVFSTQQGGVTGGIAQLKAEFPALIPLIDKVVEIGEDLWRIWSVGIYPAFQAVSSALPDLLQPLTLLDNLLGFVADNAETLGPLIVALVAGFTAYKTILFATMLLEKAALLGRVGLAIATGQLTVAEGLATISTGALNAVLALNPAVLVVAAIAALVAGLIFAYKKSETFREVVSALWGALKTLWGWIQTGVGWLAKLFMKFSPLGILISNFPKILGAAGRAWEAFKTGVGKVVDWIMDKIGPLVDAVGAVAGGIGKVVGAVGGAVGGVVDFFGGDTASRKGYGGGLASTLGAHGRLESMTPGSRTITSAVRSWGSTSGDHPAGRALDLTGSYLQTYARNVRAGGGFAEMHGAGPARHLHAVPAGDTRTSKASRLQPRGGDGAAAPIHVGALVHVEHLHGADLDDLEKAVARAAKKLKREAGEREETGVI